MADALTAASPQTDPATAAAVARRSVRMVREERMADYARTVSRSAKRWLADAQRRLDAHMAAHGYTERVWHGTGGGEFNEFRFATRGESGMDAGADGGIRMAFFSYQEKTAENYAALNSYDIDADYETVAEGKRPDVRQYYINPGKCLELDDKASPTTYVEWTRQLKRAYDEGYDSVRCLNAIDDTGARLPEREGDPMEWVSDVNEYGEKYEDGFRTDILVVFDRPGSPGANRVKAADPVTFMDDADGGLPIPLEMRADQSLPDVRYSVTMGNRAREEARRMIMKYRPLDASVQKGSYSWEQYHSQLESVVSDIASFDTPKERKAALYWYCKDAIRLPEDAPKVTEAVKTAERAKVDPFAFDRPGEILAKFSEFRPKEKPLDPDTVAEFSDRRELGEGVVTYLVDDTREGQAAVRRAIDTHWGKDANPWCLAQGDRFGHLTENAWTYWEKYDALPKRIAFKDGRLAAFMASDNIRETWWDREDKSHDGVAFSRKVAAPDGRGEATQLCETAQDGTVTEIRTERGDANDPNGTAEMWFPDGTYRMMRRTDGYASAERTIDPNGTVMYDMESERLGNGRRLTRKASFAMDDGRLLESKVTSIDQYLSYNREWYGTPSVDIRCSPYEKLLRITGIRLDDSDILQKMTEFYEAIKNGDDAALREIARFFADSAAPTKRHSVRISPDEYAKLASRVSENDARAYKAGIEPLPHGVAHTYDWGYAYDRFADGTFAVTARWNLNARNGIIYWQNEKEFYDELDQTAAVARAGLQGGWDGLRDGDDGAVWIGDATSAVSDDGLARRSLRQDGAIPEGGGDLQGARDDSGNVTGTNRHGERYSVRAVGKYAGELRRLAWGLKLAHHRAMEDAARMMAPLIPDNAVIVPMPNHEGKPVSTMLLAYYISGAKDGADVEVVPALEAEPHESNYRHKKRVGKSAEIVMRRTDAAIEPGRPVVVIDNVVASGATYRAAQKVLPEADLVTLADATRGRVGFDPSLQDLYAEMAKDEAALAETLDAASLAPADETPEQTERVRHSVFVGQSAAKSIKQYDSFKEALRLFAERHREYDDETRDEIWTKTGWWRGTDGKWRFEIRDLRPRKRGETGGSRGAVNGLRGRGDGVWICFAGEMVSNAALFKAYPGLKLIFVKVVDPDSVTYRGSYNEGTNTLTITWDDVQWFDDEPSNVPTENGLRILTHELQHAVQFREGFAQGGNVKDNGPTNYRRLAGEVEARNAARRHGFWLSRKDRGQTDEEHRAQSLSFNYAPWQTEDVPRRNQVLYDDNGDMTDIRGNRVERHSVRRGTPMSGEDIATALFAARRLAGKDVPVDEADRLIKSMGLAGVRAPDLVARANALADRNREKLKDAVERSEPSLFAALAREGMMERAREAIDRAVAGGASAADPEVGRMVQRAIESKRTRDLMAAKGFTAARLMTECPIDLARGLLAVAKRKVAEAKERGESDGRGGRRRGRRGSPLRGAGRRLRATSTAGSSAGCPARSPPRPNHLLLIEPYSSR